MAAADTVKATADTMKSASEKLKVTAEQYTTAGAHAFKDNIEKSLANLNELNAHSKKNLEAMVASATAATKGAESLGAQAMAFSKATIERQVEAAKALTSARSVQEAVELQTAFAKSAIETYMAELNRATETVSATVKESLRPLNERATAMMETFQAAR
jgi:phasin family protein